MAQTQTHPKRQEKLLYALKKLDINYQRCTRCNAFEGNAADLHTVTQTTYTINVSSDQETRDQEARTGTFNVGGYSRQVRRAIIVCKQCGFTTQYDLEILEKHV